MKLRVLDAPASAASSQPKTQRQISSQRHHTGIGNAQPIQRILREEFGDCPFGLPWALRFRIDFKVFREGYRIVWDPEKRAYVGDDGAWIVFPHKIQGWIGKILEAC